MTAFQSTYNYLHLPSPPYSDVEYSPPPPPAQTQDEFMIRMAIDRVRRSRSNTSGRTMDEASRLHLLHIAHTAVLNPRHTQIIDQHLGMIHSSGRRSRVLEVGAGTDAGTWAISLANTQPYTDVTAVDWDWSWFQPTDSVYGNLDFQTIDVSQALPFHPGTFDLIHVKCLLPCLSRYAALVERLAVILRPGGMLVLVESELGYSSNHPMSHSIRTWNACIKESMEGRGAMNLVRLIGSSGVFSSAVYHQEAAISCATSAIGDVLSLASIGRVHPDLLSGILDRQLKDLVKFGYGEADLRSVKEAVRMELMDPYSPYRQRVFAAYATKPAY